MHLFKQKNQPSRRSASSERTLSSIKYNNRPKAVQTSKPKPSNRPDSRRFSLKGAKRLLYLAVILFILVHSLIIKPTPQVSVNNTTFHSLTAYQQALKTEYQAFLNHNKITINKKSIEDHMRKKFPEITKITLSSTVFSQIPTAKITVDGPALVLSSGLESYVINAQGVAVAKLAGSASKLPSLVDQTNFPVELGKQVLAASEVDFISKILSQCSRSQVPVASLTLPPLAQELDLRTSDRPYFVKFYLGGDPAIQIGQFLAARHDFDVKNSQPSSYLDVRVSGKVYFK